MRNKEKEAVGYRGCCSWWVPADEGEIIAVGPYVMAVWREECQCKF